MATVITTINATDLITNSRTDINNNFASLNTNKIETSVLDTDSTLSADSDAKIPSQKAVKTYIDTSFFGSLTSATGSGAAVTLSVVVPANVTRMLVWAKGTYVFPGSSVSSDTILLTWNSVTKDSSPVKGFGGTLATDDSFSLLSVISPTVGTFNLQVTCGSPSNMTNVVLVCMLIP